MELEEFERVFGLFDEAVRNSEMLTEIREELETRQRLSPGRMAPVFSLAQRDGQVLSLADLRGKVVLVDFWASWCGPCRMLAPVIDQLAAEQTDVKVCKVNIDEEPGLAQLFGVMSIPTVVLFENGQEKNRSVGLVPKEKLLALLGR